VPAFEPVHVIRFIRTILDRLFRDSLGRDIVTLASGNAVAQVLQLVAVPALMLLYQPSDYGIYGVYLSAVAVLVVVAALRYDFAILVAVTRKSVFSLLTLCSVMVGAWCALLAILSIAAASLGSADPLPAIPLRYLPLLPLGVGLSALYSVCLQYATRCQHFGALRTARILYAFVTLLTQGGLFFLYRSPIGLILGEALGKLAGVLVLSHLVVVHWRQSATRVTMRSMTVVARRYSRFPRYLVAMDFLSTISRNAPVTLFAIFFGTTVAGVYGQAQRLCGAPMTLLAQAVGRVFVGRLSYALRQKVSNVRRIFREVSVRLLIMALVAVAGIATVGAFLPLILGDEWSDIRPVLLLLLPSFFALFIASPVAPSLTVLNRQRRQLVWELLRLGATVGWILLGVHLALSFESVLFTYSLVLTFCLSLLYALCRRTVLDRSRGPG